MNRLSVIFSLIVSFFIGLIALNPININAGAMAYFTTQIDSGEIVDSMFLHVVDIDGDRDLDILNSTNNGNLVLIPNNGNKTYGDPIIIATGYSWMKDIATLDYDNDGDLDILFMYQLNGTTVIVPNTGDLTFGTPFKLNPIQYGVYSVLPMDVDNDGWLDVVGTSNSSDIIFWFRNKGDGTFATQTTLVSFDGARYLKVADLNNDTYLDFIVSSHDLNRIVWFPNNGNGTFGTLKLVGAAGMPELFTVGDVDGDDDIDVVAAFNTQSSVYLFKNDGTGTFTSTVLASNGATVLVSPTSATLLDINNDGHLDVVFNSYSFGKIYSMYNDGTGTFSSLTTIVDGTLNTPFEIEAADMDDDGDDDFVVASYGSKKVSIFENNMVSKYVVRFVSNGGSLVPSLRGSAGTPVVLPEEPTKDGYNFTGWFTDKALTTPYTATTMAAEYLYVYAGWEISSQPLTFLDHDNSELFNEDFEPGSSLADVTAPTPTRVGYTFTGWDISLPATMPEEPVTLKAQYTINQYTLTFDSNGGSTSNPITDDYNEVLSLPTPTKTGYTFSGWYSDSELTNEFTATRVPAASSTLYAKWTINQYTISFEENGGTTLQDITDNYNADVTLPTATRIGHTFLGWFSDAGLTTSSSLTSIPAENITLYAKWQINPYTLSFEENGGNAVEDITGNYNSSFTLPTPTRTGYTFSGWYSDSELTNEFTATRVPAASSTLYAKWTINQYTVTYVENNGSDVDNATNNYGTNLILPTTTRIGFTFNGWYQDEGLTQLTTLTTIPGENTTLYAKWTAINYVVTYLIDGESTTETLHYGESLSNIPTPSKTGYEFDGWLLNEVAYDPTTYVQGIVEVTFVAQLRDVASPVLSGLETTEVNLSGVSTFEVPDVSVQENSEDIILVQVSYFKADGVTPLADLAQVRLELSLGNSVIVRYDAEDESGNAATPFYLEVNVKDDVKPIVQGVEDGAVYGGGEEPTVTFDEGTATLNGKPFLSGTKVTEPGLYTLIVTDGSGNSTEHQFTVLNPMCAWLSFLPLGSLAYSTIPYCWLIPLTPLLLLGFFIWRKFGKKI